MQKLIKNPVFYVFITLIISFIIYLFISAQSEPSDTNQSISPTSVLDDRFAQVTDSENKNNVSQVATALESYLNRNGTYTGADSATLVSGSYLKRFPTLVTLIVELTPNPGKSAIVYAPLTSSSYTCPAGQTGTKRWVWRTTKQDASVECNLVEPTF